MSTMTDATQPRIPDPIRAGLAAGWDVVDASLLPSDLAIEADVVIVGSVRCV